MKKSYENPELELCDVQSDVITESVRIVDRGHDLPGIPALPT